MARQWGEDLITSWNTNEWIHLPTTIGEKIAPLIGAAPGQVICCDTISVNLHKILSCCLALRKGRVNVLAPKDNFPTDLYMVQGLEQLLGEQRVQLVTVAQDELADAIDPDTAAVLFSQVNFRTGELLPAAAIARAAHAVDALVVMDLAHSAGVLPVELDSWQIDFAVGCGYKFLNGGPGAPAFIYAAQRLQQDCRQPLSGWMGHARPFDFAPGYEAGDGMQRFLCGTPPVLSMAALDAALGVFEDVSILQLCEKTQALGSCYIELLEAGPHADALRLVSPTAAEQRGGQVAMTHGDAYAICQALIARGVIMDFREPDILRAGFSPLYTRFIDVWDAVQHLHQVLDAGEHLQSQNRQRKLVT